MTTDKIVSSDVVSTWKRAFMVAQVMNFVMRAYPKPALDPFEPVNVHLEAAGMHHLSEEEKQWSHEILEASKTRLVQFLAARQHKES